MLLIIIIEPIKLILHTRPLVLNPLPTYFELAHLTRCLHLHRARLVHVNLIIYEFAFLLLLLLLLNMSISKLLIGHTCIVCNCSRSNVRYHVGVVGVAGILRSIEFALTVLRILLAR